MWREEALMHIVETVQEWKNGVIERTGIMVGLALTRTHDNFIEYLVDMDETTTFKEFKVRVTSFMERHAMARNDIYDFEMWTINLDADGQTLPDSSDRLRISRKDAEIRSLLNTFHYNFEMSTS
tara:strand:+ start:3788 stop:4159 length:372 start_codon:yes stop_codon:yes gene_type:complete